LDNYFFGWGGTELFGSELAMRIISFSIESTNGRLVYTFEDRGPYWFRESMYASISAAGSTKMSSAGTR
jgi:hypothetical protein